MRVSYCSYDVSNIRLPELSRPNSDSCVLGLYGKPLESRICTYSCEWYLVPTYVLKNLIVATSVLIVGCVDVRSCVLK